MSARLYLDWNATAPLRAEAREAMIAAFDRCGSPSSVHAEGRAARRLVEEARAAVAALVGARPETVTFTSGASEAAATVLTPAWRRGPHEPPIERLLVSAVEHVCVLRGGRFDEARTMVLPVTASGVVEPDMVAGALAAAPGRALVSVMLANNETGVIMPVAAIAALVREAGGLMHSDAAQAAGKIPVNIAVLGVDILTLSAHKLGGPMGVGAIIRADERLHCEAPLIRGGGQEKGLRAGTEAVPAIAGFGAAARAALAEIEAEAARQSALIARLAGLIGPGATLLGEGAPRLPNTLLFALDDVAAETALIALDLEGIAVSSGSACSSGKVGESHVLKAMGVPERLARGAIRVSIGRETTERDIERFAAVWTRVAGGLSRRRRAA